MNRILNLIAILIVIASCQDENNTINLKEDNFYKIEHNITDTIRICTVPKGTYIPGFTSWDNNDSSPSGTEVNFIKNMFNDLGINYIFVEKFSLQSEESDLDWRIHPLTTDDADVSIASITITPEREQYVDFSLPYKYDKSTLLVHKNSNIKSIADLGNKKILCGSTTTSHSWIIKNIPNANVITENDVVFNPEYLLLNRLIDGYSCGYEDANNLVNSNKEHLRFIDEYLFQEPIGIAVAKNNSELLEIINKYLELNKE